MKKMNGNGFNNSVKIQQNEVPLPFDLNLITTLNRSIVISTMFQGLPFAFGIMHHQKTSGLQFQYNLTHEAAKKDIRVNMFRNLETSMFCNVFCKFENVSSDRYDFRSKFSEFNENYSENVITFLKEYYDFQHHPTKSTSKNYMNVYGWKVHGIEDDLAFYFIQRKCYHPINKVDIIRTAGLQISTPAGLSGLNNYFKDMESVSFAKRDVIEQHFEGEIDFDEE